MEILVAILVIALLAAIAYAVLQRRPGGGGLGRSGASPLPRRHSRVARSDRMAAAVHEHAQAMDPADVVVAEQRLRAEARQVAARLGANATAAPVAATAYDGAASSSSYADPHADGAIDPATGQRVDGYGDPANDPRYDDPKYDGRLAADWVDPRDDDRMR